MSKESPLSFKMKQPGSLFEAVSISIEEAEEEEHFGKNQDTEVKLEVPDELHMNAIKTLEDSSALATDEEWQTHPLSVFSEKYRGNLLEDKKLSRNVRKFYKSQDKYIEDLQNAVFMLNCGKKCQEEVNVAARRQLRSNNILIKVTLFFNFLLVISKLVASILSNSLSIISSLVDSAVDLVSGLTLWFTARQIRKYLPYTYPSGRTRLEPIAVIILSVIMASVSVQIMIEAIQTIYGMAVNNQGPPSISNVTLGLIASTIVVKIGLYLICWKFGKGNSIAALKNDQINDCLSNSMALVFSTLSARIEYVPYLKYLDPSGALLIGIYIIYSWWKMGVEHTRNLSGYSAQPRFLQMISFICVNHHPLIERLETVRAVHFGNYYLVEVDIVLPRDMDLHQAHDIGETLQNKLETLETVERAFVHLDYEWAHHPQDEHKLA